MFMEPKIVDVPKTMEKYFGKGKMLHPTLEIVEELVRTIPQGKIATIDTLCKKLSREFGTNVTCPMRTGNAIKKLSETTHDENIMNKVPFWRVIRNDTQIIKSKNLEYSASKLEEEGFKLKYMENAGIKVGLKTEEKFEF